MMEYRLEELFDLQMGKTPSRSNPEYWDTKDNKWISIADLSKCGKYICETKEYISDAAVEESGISRIPVNTVVMSFKLSIGKTAITSEEMYSNEAIMSFRDKGMADLLPEYVYYLLLAHDWSEGTNKAVMGKTLNKATLSKIKVKVHTREEQIEIVDCLNRAYNVISTRQQQLQKLDELVKARFVEMFGDTEFNTMQWPTKKLSELCDVGSSKRIYQNELTTEGIPFLRISDLNERIDHIENAPELFIPINRYNKLKENGVVPTAGDILVTSRGTLGRCYIVRPEDEFYFQDGMISWLSDLNNQITSLYLSQLFAMSGIQKQIANLQVGSTVAYLSISMLKKLNIMLPPLDLQTQFEAFIEQVNKAKATVQKALDEAQLLFDSLMQKYFG